MYAKFQDCLVWNKGEIDFFILKTIYFPQTYGPWYGRAPNKEDKPTIEDIMVVYSDTLCPLLEIIDDSKADTLHRRHKAKGLLYAFFKKCQTLRSPEKVKDLDIKLPEIIMFWNYVKNIRF